ncbi:MAG TPA: hypothetical protein VJQ54_25065 [Candidatus Sulfotelmatobacter sp.]|nr:hypothetical protein [Candidatus Sulfotelmatobacter sp.]
MRAYRTTPGILATFLFAIAICFATAQQNASLHKRFTNEDVAEMAKLGLSDDVIIAKIRKACEEGTDRVNFDTSVEGLKALKAANVSDPVIKVMINPAPATPTIVAGANPIAVDPSLPPPEVGVYWRDEGKFVLLQGQTVSNTKAGGKAGSMFTYGLRGQHWDAMIDGHTSKNVVRDRKPVFFLYVPDGTDSSDYVLLKLNQKGDRREFQIGSFGGVTGGKSGVKKDKEVSFQAEHVGLRVYRLALEEALKPGEYGFFMGTGISQTMTASRGGSRSGGAASGRIYDFTVPE